MPAFLSRILQSRYAKMRELRGFIWNFRARKARSRNMYLAEQMEVRHLLSADGAPLAMDELLRSQLNNDEVVEQLILTGMHRQAANEGTQIELVRKGSNLEIYTGIDGEQITNTNVNLDNVLRFSDDGQGSVDGQQISRLQEVDGHQFVVVDPAVADIDILLESFIGKDAVDQLQWESVTHGNYSFQTASISASSSDELGATTDAANDALVTLIILDPDQDGIEQISAALAEQTNITALHILSHGSESSVQLGNTDLSNDSIEDYQQQLLAWGSALTENGDILLYGCNIAADQLGINFIDRLAGITKADIAASNDITGNRFIGGNWTLEAETGFIELSSADFFAANDPQYSGILANSTVVDLNNDEYKSDVDPAPETITATFNITALNSNSIALEVIRSVAAKSSGSEGSGGVGLNLEIITKEEITVAAKPASTVVKVQPLRGLKVMVE